MVRDGTETLRNMIRDQISDKLDVSIDPMTAVAQGAEDAAPCWGA